MRILLGPRARATGAALAAGCLGVSGLLGGCGGLSSPTGTTGPNCSTSTPGVTAHSIRIGMIYPDSGPAEIATAFAGVRSGATARVNLQNAQGGVYGRTIELDRADDQSSAPAFSAAAHKLVDTDQVFGLVTTSLVLDASASWLARADIPVTGAASSAVWSDYPNLFDSGNLFNGGGTSVYGDFVKAQGGTKAMIVYDPNVAPSVKLLQAFIASLESRRIQVVGSVPYTQSVDDPAAVAQRLRTAGADSLLGAVQSGGFIDIHARARSLGVKLAVALNAGEVNPSLAAARAHDVAGMSVLSGVAAAGTAAWLAYLRAMTSYAPEIANPADELTVDGYVSADEMIAGLRLAGPCPTRQGLIESLRKVSSYTAGGLIAPVDLTRPKDPVLCVGFQVADRTGATFSDAPPPAKLNRDGFWCGTQLSAAATPD